LELLPGLDIFSADAGGWRTMKFLLGAQVSISGGLYKAIEKGDELGFTAIQIFTRNSNTWRIKTLKEEDVARFRACLKRSHIQIVVAHDSYLINLCAGDKAILGRSRSAFQEELQRCERLGIHYLNFHPGAHGGRGEADGLKRIAESINLAHSRTPGYQVKSMIETTAGQGTSLGYRFEQIRTIIDSVEDKARICVCLDTAHVFAAGYDLRKPEEYRKVIRQFDDIIGLDRLKCIHINDSRKKLGSRVDRHEHIGKGFLGLNGFKNIMNDRKLEHVPKILETPKDKDYKDDLKNLAVLKRLIKFQ
jgi:deoxyribonuclease-4